MTRAPTSWPSSPTLAIRTRIRFSLFQQFIADLQLAAAAASARAAGLVHGFYRDLAVGCALGYLDFRFPQIDWRAAHPNLHKLYDKLATRQSFIDTAPPKA